MVSLLERIATAAAAIDAKTKTEITKGYSAKKQEERKDYVGCQTSSAST